MELKAQPGGAGASADPMAWASSKGPLAQPCHTGGRVVCSGRHQNLRPQHWVVTAFMIFSDGINLAMI